MQWFAIILILSVGLILLVVELFFIPGTTIVGVFGSVLLIGGIYLTYHLFGKMTGHIVLGSTVLLSTGALLLSLRAKTWKYFTNEQQITGKVNVENLENLSVGTKGISLSALKPYGMAQFGEQTLEVSSENGLINPDTEIVIVNISNNKVSVRKHSKG
ncbi:MAG: hypothetical protein A3G23_04385 [Bacteroidetes bacterium RIFCSPLOWO2_12_FULL_37_12]|nr:MAG: hypothetical protein A3G23_04385 [Bacteroidetes bacterium RIFCSPLOWO2_12_FULL_37_12]